VLDGLPPFRRYVIAPSGSVRSGPETMRYLLDDSQSRFTVQAFVSGALSALGHSPTFAIRNFTGEICFATEAIADARVHLKVQAGSLALTDSVSAKDRDEIESRMRQEVLELVAYPEIVFQSTEITPIKIADGWYRLAIAGKLSLHGVTNPHRLDSNLRVMEDEVRLSGDCALLQPAYRIKRVSAVGGMITLKDELKFAFELVARKQDA
jgi:polyisoprenoid-binding protein YceI